MIQSPVIRLFTIVLLTVVAFGSATSAAAESRASGAIAAMLELDRPNYNGGQSREDRAIAEAIRVAMGSRYTKRCAAPNPRETGWLVGSVDDRARHQLPSLDNVDPDLAALIRALDHPRQQVRDVAAYTLGLLGPAAQDALPFLEARFSAQKPPKGGWFNFAYGRVSCQAVVPADFRNALPDALLPPEEPWTTFLEKAAVLLPTLYLDRDFEYPPGMVEHAYGNYGFDGRMRGAVPLLARILDDQRLSEQKRVEAAAILLNRVKADELPPALPVLLRQISSGSEAIRFYVGYALVRLKRPEGVPAVVETLGRDDFADWSSEWDDYFCDMGHAAIRAEDKLVAMLQSHWPSVARRAVKALGCIGSAKAVPLLTPMLAARDWQLNAVAARAFGAIRISSPELIASLKALSASHWSLKVRTAAASALADLGAVPKPPAPAPARPVPNGTVVETVVVGTGPPGAFNHGLPWCDGTRRYSIDGSHWFRVRWIERAYQRLPTGFPKIPTIQTVGTQTFVPVPGGWLFGSDGFESEGILAFVSRSGHVQDLGDGTSAIRGIVKIHNRYFAFGFQLLKAGDAGILFEIAHTDAGVWHAESVLTLPSVPVVHAIAPTGELLLSDGPNDYAVVNGDVVPLKCEKLLPGNYFATHSEPYTRWP